MCFLLRPQIGGTWSYVGGERRRGSVGLIGISPTKQGLHGMTPTLERTRFI